MDWTKVITDPLGFTGFALALVFGVLGYSTRGRRKNERWKSLVAFALAAFCILGGLVLAYRRTAVPVPSPPAAQAAPAQTAPAPSMRVGPIQQKADNAVAGVQGNVTVNSDSSVRKQPKPR
jgi:hypothetical protein